MLKDNVLDKSIVKFIEEQEFVKRPNVQKFQREVIEVVAEEFTNNDITKATHLLDGDESQMRRSDMCIISFFSGCITLLVFLIIIMFSYLG